MFPKRPLFDIVNEADSAEVHVLVPAFFDGGDFGDVRGVRRVGKGSFDRCLVGRGDGGAVLGAAEDVGDERMVV